MRIAAHPAKGSSHSSSGDPGSVTSLELSCSQGFPPSLGGSSSSCWSWLSRCPCFSQLLCAGGGTLECSRALTPPRAFPLGLFCTDATGGLFALTSRCGYSCSQNPNTHPDQCVEICLGSGFFSMAFFWLLLPAQGQCELCWHLEIAFL